MPCWSNPDVAASVAAAADAAAAVAAAGEPAKAKST